MQLLANENIPSSVVRALRDLGYDVLAVKESMRGAQDTAVLATAVAECRLLITHDKDFGELAFRSELPADCGVVLFRLSGDAPEADCQRMVKTITSRNDWAGHFAVVTDRRLRLRRLPRPKQT